MTVPIFRQGYDGAEVEPPSALALRHALGGTGADTQSARRDHNHTALTGPLTINPGSLSVLGGTTATDRLVLGADTAMYRNAAEQLRIDEQWILGNVTPPGASVTGACIVWAEGGGLRGRSSDGTVFPLAPVRIFNVAASADLILSTTITDVTGCTTGNFTTLVPNATAKVWAFTDFEVTTAGTGFGNAYINLSITGTDDFAGAVEDRVHREWVMGVNTYVLATPGLYAIKLRGNKNAAGGASAIKINTRMVVELIG